MGFIAAALETRTSNHPIHRLDDPRVIFGNYGYAEDATGMNLSEQEVLGWPAILQALRMLGGCMGMMPCHLYERSGEGARKLKMAEEHPLHWLLHDEPHPEYTPFEFFFAVVFNAAFRGNFYGQILLDNRGAVKHVFPLDTHRMEDVRRINGRLRYYYREEGGTQRVFLDNEIFHVPGFRDGILGYAINEIARTSLAKGIAMDRFGARVFKNGMNAAGVVESDQPITWKTEDEKRKFYQSIKDALAGEDNWHTVIGLPYGMKMKTLGVTAQETQLVEAMTFQVQEAARLTGVPPSLLMENSRSTFTNTEQQMLQFVQLGLGQWIVCVEQRIKKHFLSVDERKRYTVKFLVDALLRTDLKTQNEALRTALGQPWMSVNEVRDLKELPPVDGGDTVMMPLNMADPGGNPAISGDNAPELEAPPQDGDADTRGIEYRNGGRAGHVPARRHLELRNSNAARRRLRAAFQRTITREAARLVRAEIRQIRKLMDAAGVEPPAEEDARAIVTRADTASLLRQLQTWYTGAGFNDAFDRILAPVLRDYAEAMADAAAAQKGAPGADVGEFLDAYLGSLRTRTAGSHNGQLAKLIREADAEALHDTLAQRLDEWENGREDGERMSQAQKIGSREAVQLGEAIASAAWKTLGVSALVWIASGDACPICDELDGQVVGIDAAFVEASDEIDPDDDSVPVLKTRSPVRNPPIHAGCECEIAPE